MQFNVYGYSSLVSGLQINLRAVVKDYSIIYSVSKQEVQSAIVEDDRDFEYYHEIRAKIEQSYFKEIWEAPRIANTREHYLPNPYYILKRQNLAASRTQQRLQRPRTRLRSKSYIQAEIQRS